MENSEVPPPSDIEHRIAFLEQRVEALERQSGQPAPPAPGIPPSVAPNRPWAVEVLQGRSGPPFDGARSRGSLLYAGSLIAPGTGAAAWQIERPVPWLLEQEWERAAPLLAALGHPVRLEIIRRLLDGAHTSQELQEIADLGTTGRLYHHLRELQASGLIISPRRNHYTIPPQKVVPCLVIVTAAAELAAEAPVPYEPEEGSTC